MAITQGEILSNTGGSFFGEDVLKPKPSMEATSLSVLSSSEREIYDSLSERQKAEVTKFISGIDLSSPEAISDYGKATRQNISSLNRDVLNQTKTKDLGQVGTCMTSLMMQLKQIDVSSQSRGIFGRIKSGIEQLRAQLAPIQANVDKAVKIMEKHQDTLRADNQTYESLYVSNLAYYKDLTLYIICGRLRLEQEKAVLKELHDKAASTGDLADAEKFNAYSSKIDQFEQLLNELESSRILCLQNAPTIRMAQSNNTALIQKFDFIFNTAVPAWQTQISIAINLENSKQAAQAANAAIDFTNDMIRKNADMLRQGTVGVAKLTEREIISADTLEYSNRQLIEGLKDVFAIHEEGRIQRNESHTRKMALEEDMKRELLALSSPKN